MQHNHWKTPGAACLALLLLMVGANGAAFAQSQLYWTDTKTNTIERANLDGSNVETIVNGVTLSLGMAVDQINDKIYWVDIGQFIDSGFGDEVIRRANLDGTGVETILTTADGLRHPWAIQVDPVGGKVYWADGNTQKIYRADLDGQNAELLIDIPSFRAADYGVGTPTADGSTPTDRNLEFSNVGGIALDVNFNDLYWTDYFAGDIHRASMDGTLDGAEITQLVSGLSSPRGIAVDDVEGRMYWVDGAADEIMRAFTDGSGMEVLVSKDLGTRLKMPFRIGLDTIEGLMYWTERDNGLIQRANLDGSGVTTLLTLEYQKKPGEFRPTSPSGLALNFTSGTAPSAPQPDPTPAPAQGEGENSAPDLTGIMDKLRLKATNGGEQLEFEYTVQNIGTGPLVGIFTIQAFLSTNDIPDQADTLLATWIDQDLGTGAALTHKSRLDLSGSHTNEFVLIVIDAGNAIAELDESNNLLVEQILP